MLTDHVMISALIFRIRFRILDSIYIHFHHFSATENKGTNKGFNAFHCFLMGLGFSTHRPDIHEIDSTLLSLMLSHSTEMFNCFIVTYGHKNPKRLNLTTWNKQNLCVFKTTQSTLFFLRRLKSFEVSKKLLNAFDPTFVSC